MLHCANVYYIVWSSRVLGSFELILSSYKHINPDWYRSSEMHMITIHVIAYSWTYNIWGFLDTTCSCVRCCEKWIAQQDWITMDLLCCPDPYFNKSMFAWNCVVWYKLSRSILLHFRFCCIQDMTKNDRSSISKGGQGIKRTVISFSSSKKQCIRL